VYLVETMRSTMFVVAWFVFTHVPVSAVLGGGGTGVAVDACAGDKVNSADAVTAAKLISAAVTPRQVRFIEFVPSSSEMASPFWPRLSDGENSKSPDKSRLIPERPIVMEALLH
jgi:hypothetical protein